MHGQHERSHHGEHRDPSTMGHLIRVMDRLQNIVTADLIVDFGVFLTGCTLIFLELGLVPHRPFEDDDAHVPQTPAVRVEDSGH